MNTGEMVAAFNEWMRRYTEHPEQFEADFRSVGLFLAESATGKIPSYGDECAAYMQKLLAELTGHATAEAP